MKLENLIKSKAMKLIIFCIIAIVVFTGALVLIMSQKSFYQAFGGAKEIHTYSELNDAKYNNAYVKLYFSEVYDTGYEHTLDGKTDAYYLDFDVDGYMVFGLVKKDLAEKLLNKEQNYIEGELCEFTKENKEALDTIINDYIDRYKEDGYTASDVKSAVFPKQIDNLNYSDTKTTPFFVLFIFGAIDVIFLIFGIKSLLVYLNPSKKITDDRVKDEYEDGDFTDITKGLYHSRNYIFYETMFKIEYKKLQDMAWAYRRVVKQNFVTTYKGTVITFIDRTSIQVAVQSDELFEKLMALNPNILIGYTQENIQKYAQLAREYKEQNKEVIK